MKKETCVLAVVSLLCMIGCHEGEMWIKGYGGNHNDVGWSIAPAGDGGVVIAGFTDSFGTNGFDWWIVKMDEHGNIQWEKRIGSPGPDYAYFVRTDAEGNHVVTGTCDYDVNGITNIMAVKLDPGGLVTWQKIFLTEEHAEPAEIHPTTDGGYIIAGYTAAFGAASYDAWVIKLSSDGHVEWAYTYGGEGHDSASSMAVCRNGGYVIAGITRSFGAVDNEVWVLKLDGSGNIEWQYRYPTVGMELVQSIIETSDGGFAVAVRTDSFGAGSVDAWIIKLDDTGGILWSRTFGGTDADWMKSMIQTDGQEIVMAGTTRSWGPANHLIPWVVKLDPAGNIRFEFAFTAYGVQWGSSICSLPDGSLMVLGTIDPLSPVVGDWVVLKTNAAGLISINCDDYSWLTDAIVRDPHVVRDPTHVEPVSNGVEPEKAPVTVLDTTALMTTVCSN